MSPTAEASPGTVETSPGVVLVPGVVGSETVSTAGVVGSEAVSTAGVVGSEAVSTAGVPVAGVVSGLTTGTCSAVVVPGTVFTATAPVVLGATPGGPGTPLS